MSEPKIRMTQRISGYADQVDQVVRASEMVVSLANERIGPTYQIKVERGGLLELGYRGFFNKRRVTKQTVVFTGTRKQMESLAKYIRVLVDQMD